MNQYPIYQNDSSVHCIGNGLLAAYERGPNIFQIFGPPYSSPSYMQYSLCEKEGLFVISQREPGTAVWHHKVTVKGRQIGEMVDFMAEGVPAMIRMNRFTEPLDFQIEIEKQWEVCYNGGRYQKEGVSAAFLAFAYAGISVYEHVPYPSRRDIAHQVMIRGDASLDENLHVRMNPGESVLYWVGGADYPACVLNSEWVLRQNPEKLLKKTRDAWRKFTDRRADFESLVPQTVPEREKLLNAIDDVSVLIKTQQSKEGGILAGHNYHMAYVRDQYGTSRCLLELGYFKEAKRILEFYFSIFLQYHEIHNAQTIGDSHHFHIHENDNVEITGYLIIQAFDYYGKSRDKEFLKRILPMLEWAWEAQVKELKEGMLPFNGDETYVAGGILPRTVLCQGSAESTLLFIAAGERLLTFVKAEGLWKAPRLNTQWELYQEARDHYKERFYHNGDLAANRPFVGERAGEKRFLHGVCQYCGSFGWNELTAEGRYACRACFGTREQGKPQPETYRIPSVKLMPMYLGATVFDPGESKSMTASLKRLRDKKPEKAVGYDGGILLYSLCKLHDPDAIKIYEETLSLLDSAGGWSEYYVGQRPQGTRYRPWESGINLEAAIQFACGR